MESRKVIARTWPQEEGPGVARSTEQSQYGRDFPGSKGPTIPGLSIPHHDTAVLQYDGEGNLVRIDYYIDGETGLLVSTILLQYDGGNLTQVNRINPGGADITP